MARQKDYPAHFRKIAKTVKQNGGFSQKAGDDIAALIKEGGWLWGLLYLDKPLPKSDNNIVNISEGFGDNCATLEQATNQGRFIPMYTAEHYPNNLKDIVKIKNFPFLYLKRITVESMLEKAKNCNLAGVIINPQIEGITISWNK